MASSNRRARCKGKRLQFHKELKNKGILRKARSFSEKESCRREASCDVLESKYQVGALGGWGWPVPPQQPLQVRCVAHVHRLSGQCRTRPSTTEGLYPAKVWVRNTSWTLSDTGLNSHYPGYFKVTEMKKEETNSENTPQCRATTQEQRGNTEVNLKPFASVYMINLSNVKNVNLLYQ